MSNNHHQRTAKNTLQAGDTYWWDTKSKRLGVVKVTIMTGTPLIKVQHGYLSTPFGRGEVYEWKESVRGTHVNVSYQFEVKYRSGSVVTKTETEVVPIRELKGDANA